MPIDRKQALVDDVFHTVADRYDLMNDLMSAGLPANGRTFRRHGEPSKTSHGGISTSPADRGHFIPDRRARQKNAHSTVSDINATCWRSKTTRRRSWGFRPRRNRRGECREPSVPLASFDLYTIALRYPERAAIPLALARRRVASS